MPLEYWMPRWSLSSGARSRDPLAGHDSGEDVTQHSRDMNCPSFASSITLEIKGAQGMPDAETHPLPCVPKW
jgi:hypothetical protein